MQIWLISLWKNLEHPSFYSHRIIRDQLRGSDKRWKWNYLVWLLSHVTGKVWSYQVRHCHLPIAFCDLVPSAVLFLSLCGSDTSLHPRELDVCRERQESLVTAIKGKLSCLSLCPHSRTTACNKSPLNRHNTVTVSPEMWKDRVVGSMCGGWVVKSTLALIVSPGKCSSTSAITFERHSRKFITSVEEKWERWKICF